MQPVESLEAHDIHVWRIPLAVDPVAQQHALALLSRDERARASAFVRPIDRERWPLARAGMRQVLASYLNVSAAQLVFGTEARKKPTLEGAGNLCFNLSHSNAWALLAVTRSGPVGVDIEHMRPLKDLQQLHGQLFSPREQAVQSQAPGPPEFYRAWVHKEAIVKGMGTGLYRELATLDLSLDPNGNAHSEGWSSQLLAVIPGYLAAVASRDSDARVRLFAGPHCI